MQKLRIGMTKDEVVEIMGDPQEVRGAGHKEILEYRLGHVVSHLYWLVLEDGKLASYGRQGDFGTTDDWQKHKVDVNVTTHKKDE